MIRKLLSNKAIVLSLIMILFCTFLLSSCGEKYGKTTAYLNASKSSGCFGGSSIRKTEWIKDYLEKDVIMTDSEDYKLNGTNITNPDGSTTHKNGIKDNYLRLIAEYANFKAIAESDDEKKIAENYKVNKIVNLNVKYESYVSNITEAVFESIEPVKASLDGNVGCLDTKMAKKVNDYASSASQTNDAYLLASLYVIEVDKILTELEPIKFKARTVGEFFSNFWTNIFIFPLGWLLYAISSLLGGYYIVGLFIVTLLVRTMGWPIYAKTNDMSVKMAALTPQLEEIKQRYAGKNDPESQRRMQMEQAQLYKKNKVGLGGCLAPFLQFPIFMAIYRAISRIPYTKAIEGSAVYNLDWANKINSNFLGINLFEDRNLGTNSQLIGILILIVLVVGTQVASQLLSQYKQKKMQETAQEDIPAYRRQAYKQTQGNGANQMKFMLWFMTFMMGMFVWQSKAGLGVYWLIGNLYSMGQMAINNKRNANRLVKEQNAKKNTVYTINTNKKK